jgi:hypothetical protein
MKLIAAILLFGIGYLTGSYTYSKAFDPDNFLKAANELAADSYLEGCLTASKGPTDEKPFDYKISYCKHKAQELLDRLEALRRQQFN